MLIRKMLRDLYANKTQFIAIFIMAFLSVYVFVGLDCEVNGCATGIERYYEETNLFDAKIVGASFNNESLAKLRNMEEIKIAEPKTTVKGFLELDQEYDVEINFIDTNNISSMKYVEGESYTKGAKGIWLDYIFVQKNQLSIGDNINIKISNQTINETLKGTFMNPEYVYYLVNEAAMMPEYGKYAFGFMSSNEYPGEFSYTQVLLDLEGVDNKDDLSENEINYIRKMKSEIKRVLANEDLVITDKSQALSYATYNSEMSQHKNMAFIFPVVFMLISVLGIITTMTRMTANQRVQIGTLKALGFSRMSILFHYVTYGIVLSFAGAIAGALISYYSLADLMITEMATAYINPYARKLISMKAIVIILMAVFVSGFVSYLSCRKILSDNAATILRPAAPKLPKHSGVEKSRFWLGLDFSTQWNIRDIMRNKVRSLMGIVGVAGCTMLLVAAFGCLDTVDYVMDWMYGSLITGNYKVIFESDATYGLVYDIAKKYDGQMIEEAAIEISNDINTKAGTAVIIDEGNYYHFQDENLRSIFLSENSVAISYKMAENLNLSIGDFITFNLVGDNDHYTVRVEQLFRTPSGQGIAMNRETFEKLGEKFKPNTVYTNKNVPENIKDQDYIVGRQSIGDMMEGLASMMEMMYLMVGVLVIAAIVLGVVVLYNMGVLSFVEKTREISTLKVLGFQSRTIRGILQKQNIWITTLGILMGMPMGRGILVLLFSDMGESMDYMAIIYPVSYLYSVIGTFIVSILVNRLLSRKVSTINMVDALKGVE